ncbi:putative peptidase C14, partial [Rhizoctonia solani 123E]
MMTFWPKSAPIAKHYSQLTHGPFKAEGTALDQRQLAHLATWAFDNGIDAMAVSPDGQYIALGMGQDVLVLGSSSGQVVLGPLHGPSNRYVGSIIFSPDQTYILAGFISYNTRPATIIGWDTRTGNTVLGPLLFHKQTLYSLDSSQVRLSPDCTCIADLSYDENIRLCNTRDGELLHCLETQGRVSDAAFSSDGIHIAAAVDESLQIWNSQTGDTTLGPLTTGSIGKIAFSPDKSCIIHTQNLYEATEPVLYVRDAQNGDIIHKLKPDDTVFTHFWYSPDSSHIVSGGHSIHVWDAQNGKMVLGPLEGHTSSICSVGFLSDSSRLVSASSDGLVCTWDARQRNLTPKSTSARSSNNQLAKFSTDGMHFVSYSNDKSLCIYDSHTGAMVVGPLATHTNSKDMPVLVFTKDHVAIGSGDGISVYDALSGQALSSCTVASGTTIMALTYSQNGTFIAAGVMEHSHTSEMNLWDTQTGTKVLGPLKGIDGRIQVVQFSPDSAHLAAAYSSRPASSAHSTRSEISYLPSQILLGVWDVTDGKNVLRLLTDHTEDIHCISYSPDGALIALGSTRYRSIRVWDAYTGSKILDLVGSSGWITSVHFSPDSTRLVSGSWHSTIEIWDVRTGEMVFELLHGHEQGITSVAYSPDGTRILSCSSDGTVRIHDAQSIEVRV